MICFCGVISPKDSLRKDFGFDIFITALPAGSSAKELHLALTLTLFLSFSLGAIHLLILRRTKLTTHNLTAEKLSYSLVPICKVTNTCQGMCGQAENCFLYSFNLHFYYVKKKTYAEDI